uniref:Secreted protein n=1 Tax=Lygus hesperus TaxID=30085 RepID=A0A146L2T1_LYGHE
MPPRSSILRCWLLCASTTFRTASSVSTCAPLSLYQRLRQCAAVHSVLATIPHPPHLLFHSPLRLGSPLSILCAALLTPVVSTTPSAPPRTCTYKLYHCPSNYLR